MQHSSHSLDCGQSDSHQTMISVLVWDTGRPNGDQCHPLVPVGPVVQGTAATCLNLAVACPHYGSNATTSLSMGEGYIYLACKSNQMALNAYKTHTHTHAQARRAHMHTYHALYIHLIRCAISITHSEDRTHGGIRA